MSPAADDGLWMVQMVVEKEEVEMAVAEKGAGLVVAVMEGVMVASDR